MSDLRRPGRWTGHFQDGKDPVWQLKRPYVASGVHFANCQLALWTGFAPVSPNASGKTLGKTMLQFAPIHRANAQSTDQSDGCDVSTLVNSNQTKSRTFAILFRLITLVILV
jgi:hypothetical protein